ncbi:MAG: hypothetical protein O2783_00615 [Chloroflexi bacterium]|nr:hypothetical protein [Chloroflexota bacterium]
MTTFSQAGSGAVFVPRTTQKALDQEIIDRFLERAAGLGIQPTPLGLKLLGAGLLGLLHTAGTYRVSWQKEVRISIPGILSFAVALPRQGVFTRYRLDKVLMSVEAEAFRQPLATLWEIEDTAVLAEEVDPILAVKVAGRWFEVYRWLKRPYLLNDEEARHLARLL